jgi:hypothetical protein
MKEGHESAERKAERWLPGVDEFIQRKTYRQYLGSMSSHGKMTDF